MLSTKMATTTLLLLSALSFSPSRVEAWTSRWDHSKRFAAAGHVTLACGDNGSLEASCCLCKSIVHEIETQLNNTQDDYEVDVVYRISEEKRKVKFSRSEGRILEVLDDVCDALPLELPTTTKKSKNLVRDACTAFVGVYEDELTHVFFDDFSPARDRTCTDTLHVCVAPAPSSSADRQDL